MLARLNQIENKLHRLTYRAFKTPRELVRLQQSAGALGSVLAEALRGTVNHEVSPEEARSIQEIELLRHEMEASKQEVEILNLGASPGRIVRAKVGDVCSKASKRPALALLMFRLVRELKPETILELGTCVGISASYQTMALRMNGHGRLYTLEGAPALAFLAEANLRSLNLQGYSEVVIGAFADTLPGVLQKAQFIDLAFIDGHHDYAATLEYFEQIRPFLRPSSVVVFDDIAWSEGMINAWRKIVSNKHVCISVDLFSMGLCTVSGPKETFRIAVA